VIYRVPDVIAISGCRGRPQPDRDLPGWLSAGSRVQPNSPATTAPDVSAWHRPIGVSAASTITHAHLAGLVNPKTLTLLIGTVIGLSPVQTAV
jgi:hypothetical protein